MRSAGTPGAYAGVIHHRGRVSGRAYATPVGIIAADDDFLIVLPYGTHAQWVRNVLADGAATLEHEGQSYAVDRPELVPLDAVATHLPAVDRRLSGLLGTSACLRLRRVAAGAPADRLAVGLAA
jgi:deazaflavin-dependent oxidoreductase (nitroreductase family)